MNYPLAKNALLALFFVSTILLANRSMAQETPKFEKSIMLYANGTVSSFYPFEFGRITPALRLTNSKGNFHELELTQLTLAKRQTAWNNMGSSLSPSVATYSNAMFSFRYEYGIEMFKKRDLKRMHIYSGFAINPMYGYLSVNPQESNTFTGRSHHFAVSTQFIPRLSYDISDRFSIDLSVPINLSTALVDRSSIMNPALTRNAQRNTGLHTQVLPTDLINFRIGLKFRF